MKNALLALAIILLAAGVFFAFSGSSSGSSGNARGSDDNPSEDEDKNAPSAGADGNSSGADNSSGDGDDGSGTGRGRDSDGEGGRTRDGQDEKKWEDGNGDIRIRMKNIGELRQYALRNNITLMQAAMLAINESELKCRDEGGMRGRIKCRLELPSEEEEEGLYYLPEECRNLTNDTRRECLARYHIIQPCRFEQGDDSRFSCVRNALNITKRAKEAVEECKLQVRGANWTNARNGTNATGNSTNWTNPGIGKCMSEVRKNVYEEAKFRMYNLEEKAERLAKFGVGNETITSIIAKLEELKLKFDAAQGAEAKKAVLREAADAWKQFIQQAREEAKANRAPRNSR